MKSDIIVGAILIVLVIAACLLLSLGVSWGVLSVWNWFSISAELNTVVPVNWGTVIGLSVILFVLRSIFWRSDSK
ncbi:Uncharacterised protein [Providencia rettgeri]|uniref:hypothetical protein n=1 Tax=Providencia rettgeri TaxID=587 RepID=UPI001EF546EE|nr:hypothetical protein [Providencia rettgeri]CAB5587514.1 Uncharacterised protein [Providencia rettgeri]CAC9124827.1 Uncharacterised protein [Providencia rettgeri]